MNCQRRPAVPMLRVAMVCAVLMLGAASGSRAQVGLHPVVTVVNGLDLGSLYREETKAIAPGDHAAARFRISGVPGRHVTVTVVPENLAAEEDRNGRNQSVTIPVTVLPSDCEYSVDGGATWIPFLALVQDIQLPNLLDRTGETTADVRVGCRATSAADQQRGRYEGTVSLEADYALSSDGRKDDGIEPQPPGALFPGFRIGK